jgi:hypothetical protein
MIAPFKSTRSISSLFPVERAEIKERERFRLVASHHPAFGHAFPQGAGLKVKGESREEVA